MMRVGRLHGVLPRCRIPGQCGPREAGLAHRCFFTHAHGAVARAEAGMQVRSGAVAGAGAGLSTNPLVTATSRARAAQEAVSSGSIVEQKAKKKTWRLPSYIPPTKPLSAYAPFVEPRPQAWVTAWDNTRLGIVDLLPDLFAQEIRRDLLLDVVLWQRAARRLGNKTSLTRATVNHTTRKPFAQKGLGVARQGTLKAAPHMRKGGRAHGKVARNFYYPLPLKVRQRGLKVALSAKFKEGNFALVDNAELPSHKTGPFAKHLQNRGLTQRTLIIDGNGEPDPNFRLAARNVPYLHILPARGANVYDILLYHNLVVTLSGLRHLETRLRHPAREPFEWESERSRLPVPEPVKKSKKDRRKRTRNGTTE